MFQAIQDRVQKLVGMKDQAMSKGNELMDQGKSMVDQAKEKVEDKVEDIKEKVTDIKEEGASRIAKAGEHFDNIKEQAGDMVDNAKQAVQAVTTPSDGDEIA